MEHFWEKIFFSLRKLEKNIILVSDLIKMCEMGGGGPKGEKNFYAFLDELGHSEYFLKLKKKKNGPWPPPFR